MSLHTRSLMYGKLHDGVLVEVTPTLMKRLKQHFHTFDFGVHAIFGARRFAEQNHAHRPPVPRRAESVVVAIALPPA